MRGGESRSQEKGDNDSRRIHGVSAVDVQRTGLNLKMNGKEKVGETEANSKLCLATNWVR